MPDRRILPVAAYHSCAWEGVGPTSSQHRPAGSPEMEQKARSVRVRPRPSFEAGIPIRELDGSRAHMCSETTHSRLRAETTQDALRNR
ncbi:hypothetical protein OPT61_g10450 [Boeremia exigua]|uniref:Uncharacterized protein n=1 Tax=Boeremia exigua TaxID=749465 RepID=A0ACC2HQ77_9PLEO|nr:hypothetical protein OPT61_g10450 [Boeremia exigua]